MGHPSSHALALVNRIRASPIDAIESLAHWGYGKRQMQRMG
jgi:hypothetical protein